MQERREIGCCSAYGSISAQVEGRLLSLHFDDDCEEHSIEEINNLDSVQITEADVEAWLLMNESSFAVYQWYLDGQPISQLEALQVWLEL